MKISDFLFIAICFFLMLSGCTVKKGFEIIDGETWFRGERCLVVGLRCSNALINDNATDELIRYLPVYKSYGLNTVSVFLMGSFQEFPDF